MRACFALVLLSLGIAGCSTHHSLRKNTLCIAETLADINCQQVLDNVARFVVNVDSMPSLAVVNSGTVIVTDQSSVGGAGTYAPTLTPIQQLGGFPILSLFATPNVSHSLAETWSVTPVTEADKLRRIRCAFQLLVRGNIEGVECEDCQDRLNEFFSHDQGTEQCELPSGWFQMGSKCDVPKNACYVSNHCDTWVWVTSEGIDGLTRFTMSIMELATHSLDVHSKVVVRKFNGENVLQSTEVTTQEADVETQQKRRKIRTNDGFPNAAAPQLQIAPANQGSVRTPRGTTLSPKQARKRGDLSPSLMPKFE